MDSCIEWQGARNKKGYGWRMNKEWAWTGTYLVHRQVWMAEHGFIPSTVLVLHSCDNPACHNIEHLRTGTPADNSADIRDKQGPRRNDVPRILRMTPQQKLARYNTIRAAKRKKES